jgi:uncharacterized protein (UPF0335 family)
MAEFEEKAFQFPDEIEKETKIEVSAEDDNIEIEIEDDTPEQDRNVEPLPENVKQELYDDELEDYSAKVKKKLLQLKKLAHDERREKDQALREHHEALALAQRVIEENKRLKNSVNENEKSILLSVTKAVELEMEKAKDDYKKAYESGDTDRVIDAQQKLTELSMKQDKVRNFKPTPLQIEEPVVQMRQQAPRPDPTAVDWQQRNTWFGEDDEMTSLALGLHEKLKKEGVVVASPEYYKRIDNTMRQRFPEKFETEIEDKSERSTRPSTVVAPATRSTSSKKIRLTTSQLSIAKKLGLTNEQYAQAVLKMES